MNKILGLAALCALALLAGCAAFTDSCPAGSDYYSDCRVARREHIREQMGIGMQGLAGMGTQPQGAAPQAAPPGNCIWTQIGDGWTCISPAVQQTAPQRKCIWTQIGDGWTCI